MYIILMLNGVDNLLAANVGVIAINTRGDYVLIPFIFVSIFLSHYLPLSDIMCAIITW